MRFVDTFKVGAVRIRDDGCMVADAKVARTGIYHYTGAEVGKPEMPVVKVYRSADEVFSPESMASFTHRPVTDDHPPEFVTADNWRQYAVGGTSTDVAREGDFLRVPLMISDSATIQKVQGGKVELSNAYNCALDFTPGVTPDGEQYDARQTDIRGNHVAVVGQGRAGSECRIGDNMHGPWGVSPKVNGKGNNMNDQTTTRLIDGVPYTVSAQIDALITNIVSARDTAVTDAATAAASHATAMAAKDAELAAKDAEITTLKAATPTVDQMTKMVADRAALEASAKTVAPTVNPTGMTDSALKKAVVIAKLGDAVFKAGEGKSEDYNSALIDATFAQVVAAAPDVQPATPFVDQFSSVSAGGSPPVAANDHGHGSYVDSLVNGWRGAAAGVGGGA